MLQATVCDCLAVDPFAFEEDGLSASEVDVSRGKIVEALVIAGMVVMRHEGGDLVFAFVRWASNDFGTIISRIDIVRAVAPGEPYATLPFVRPGGDILLRINGWPKVDQVLQAIETVEASGVDPADAAPDHWRHVHNR